MYKNVYKFDDMKRAQHNAVRETVGWYLFTHQLMEVMGEDAVEMLEKIFPKKISNISVGSARYTTMLNEDGIIIDDVVVFRMADEVFWISTLYVAKGIAHFELYKGDLRVTYRNITDEWEMYSVQGPRAKDMINAIVSDNVDSQKFFTIRDNSVSGVSVKIARSGFTGEQLGYEIYVAPDEKGVIEETLRAREHEFSGMQVTELQVMVWTLSTEKGMYLMCDLRGNNPLEVGLEKGIDWEKDFIGRETLLKNKEEGPKRELLGFTVAEDNVHIPSRHFGGSGTAVMYRDDVVGWVTKFTYGFCIEKNIGYALVDKGVLKKGDIVSLNDFDAVIVDKPFV